MNIKLQRGEISTIVVLGALVIVGAATILNAVLERPPQTISTRAQVPLAACPYNSGNQVVLGQTEGNSANMEARWPISEHRHEYDFFSYFVPATEQEARDSRMPVYPKEQYLTYADVPSPGMDNNLTGMMGKMFGYKPTRLADAYFMKYLSSELQGNDTLVKGIAPAIQVPIVPGDPVYMPDTLYSIGDGMEAMVMFAANDRLTLHIGRSEYMVGSGNNCNGKACSGGIWLYVRGICVDQQIVDAYNSVRSGQEAAQADKSSITLPMVQAGRILGKATTNKVEVIMRDNGPLLSLYKAGFWTGVPEKDVSRITPTIAPTETRLPQGSSAVTVTPVVGVTSMPVLEVSATPGPIDVQKAPTSRTVSEPGKIATFTIELTEDVIATRCPEDFRVSEDMCILLSE